MLCPEVVGRADDLAWLSAGLDQLTKGQGSALFLTGESGIGKSRVAGEAVAGAKRRGVTVLAGRGSPVGTVAPYQPLTGALLQGVRSRTLAEIEGVDALRPGLATLLPGFVDGPALPPSPVLLGETVLRLGRLLGGDRGTLLVLEDLHWADPDTLAVLEYLADNTAVEPMMLLGTARQHGAVLRLIDALEQRGSAAVRTLAPLTRAQVAEMVRLCLSCETGDVPDAVVEVLDSRAEGLPFLVEELLAGLADGGALKATGRGWELRGDADVDVPVSFSQTVRDRTAGLGTEGTKVLQAAAVLGRDFDWSLLAPMAGVPESAVLDALRVAVEHQLVEQTEGGRFRFRNALTVDAVRGAMLGPQRAQLSERALTELTRTSDTVPRELSELAANLAAQAGRSADASRYLADGARQALSAGAITTAIVAARRARDAVSRDHPQSLVAAELLLSACSAAGDTAAVESLGRELLPRLDGHGGSAERAGAVRLLLAKAAHSSLEFAEARRLCQAALAADFGDLRLRLELQMVLAEIAFSEREHLAAVEAAEAVLAGADANGFADLACDALYLLGRYRLLVTFEVARGEQCFEELLRRADGAGLVKYRVQVLEQMAQVHVGQPNEDTLARIHDARSTAEELGALALTAELDHVLSIAYLSAHQLDVASACAGQALTEARRYRLGELAAVAVAVCATIEAERGHREAAERLIVESEATGELGPQISPAVSASALILSALADDDLASAARRVEETQALLPQTIAIERLFAGLYYGLAAVVKAASGAPVLVEGRDWFAIDDVYLQSSFDVAQAIVAGRNGDGDGALARFDAGDRRLARLPWLQALYRRYAAEAAISDGWGQPGQWLAEAEALFEHCDNQPLARACRSLLRLTGASPRRHVAATGGGSGPELTAREADVLGLVAAGLTNKQIAARLYLSVRTVEKHVERILTKTGLPNRTALAALASARASEPAT